MSDMRSVPVDASKFQFRVDKLPEPKTRWAPEGQPRQQMADKETGEFLFVTQLHARSLDGQGGSTIVVTTVGEPPKITLDQLVVPVDLVATPWNQEDNGRSRSGIAFRAKTLQAVKATAGQAS